MFPTKIESKTDLECQTRILVRCMNLIQNEIGMKTLLVLFGSKNKYHK